MYEQNVLEDLVDAHIPDLASLRRTSSCDVPSIYMSALETPKRTRALERKQNKK